MEGIFEIKPNEIKQVEMEFNEMYRIIQQCITRLESVCSQLGGSEYSRVISTIQSMKETCDKEGKSIKSLNEVLMEIVRNYENIEKKIVDVKEVDSRDEKDTLKDLFSEYKSNLKQDVITSMVQSGGKFLVKTGGLINVVTSVARGTGENAFVILNPNVINKTSKIIKGGNWIATGAGYGLPVIAGLMDFAAQLSSGENVKDAAIKAGLHTATGAIIGGAVATKVGGAVGGAIGSLITPGIGTVAGAAAGIAVGTAVTLGANKLIDCVYDNWDDIKQTVSGTWNDVKETVSETWDNVKETTSETWNDVKETASETWDNVKETISETWDNVKETASETWDDVKETTSQIWNTTTNVIANTKNKVGNAVKGFEENLGTVFG